ncbi:GIY-YIG nuclease family protein [Lactococcus garvieae]|jgi:putative endonuclease|uniref:GIY-YIG nuclease family protein n=1 Tax=Lactococcus garvieae TaxID=1363 RepID=UPI0005B4220A|nr:GIY-YIG nuclease family protein [Lactococcus garvieae]QPS70300.1 GIY-YIG nuclease family protein [Lactococcus garvieae]
MKSYFVYVLRCADGTLYCGYTDNVTKRLETHNAGKGAKYTKARRPLELITSVEFDDKATALKCEWWFKHKLTRPQKLKLIKEELLKETFEQVLEAKKRGQ